MSDPKRQTARQVAFWVLNKFDVNRHDAGELLHKRISLTDQRGQATDLVYGAIRNMPAIDMVIEQAGSTPIKRISKKLLAILRIGAYELIYAPQTAEYAIVNEAVDLTHSVTGKKPAGFVNAVLRNLTRAIVCRDASLEGGDLRKTLPQSETNGCAFKDDVLPDPEADPSDYLSKGFSIPDWLVRGWISEFDLEVARGICFASNRRPGIFLAANTLKVSAEGLLEKLRAEGIECAGPGESGLLKLKSHVPVSEIAGFSEGLFTVQDPAQVLPVRMLLPKPGQRVLDMCAAPGGKTVQMAQMMEDRGSMIASDIDVERLVKVDDNCKRLGITIVKTVIVDEASGDFDAVLVDAPCSNTGVMARRCEVRLRINENAVKELAKTQLQLLTKAGELAHGGGRICYSTCSIMKDENSGVVESFLAENKSFVLESEKLTLPSLSKTDDTTFDHDGGYAAIILKR
ncbi:hypothetical protein LCGC14_2329360 [marine sediment metagenome]|uniref:SAM-dependent MTase RsmB/NOP-type domain-containing protein n=1 Tax=marine sediment metagenome TaxID=412755 RepID=A0A0F9CG04_9ZZZZ